jgi:hypothetical protein
MASNLFGNYAGRQNWTVAEIDPESIPLSDRTVEHSLSKSAGGCPADSGRVRPSARSSDAHPFAHFESVSRAARTESAQTGTVDELTYHPIGASHGSAGASQRMTPGWKSSSLSGLAPRVRYCLLATITFFTASPCAVFPVCVPVSVLPSAETTTLVVTVGLPSTLVVTSKVWSSTRL